MSAMSYTGDLKPRPLTRKQLNERILQMPFNHLLGFNVTRLFKDGLTLECEITETKQNGMGTLHGGVTATLVDAAVGIALLGQLGGQLVTTVELKVSYLRPATHGKIRARARLLKVGKTLAMGTVDVHDPHGRLVASGSATYMIL